MEDGERGQGAGGVSTLPTVETQLQLTQFTEVLAADTPVHFQLLDLGEQLMVWIGTGGARLENLSVAMPTKCGPDPRPRPRACVLLTFCLPLPPSDALGWAGSLYLPPDRELPSSEMLSVTVRWENMRCAGTMRCRRWRRCWATAQAAATALRWHSG